MFGYGTRDTLPVTTALGDLASLNDVRTACLQYRYSENRPYGHPTFTLAAGQYFHLRLWGQLSGAGRVQHVII